MIRVNENFLPNGIVYDLKFIKTLSKVELISGSIDSVTHCLESLSSTNKNDYLWSFSNSATVVNNQFSGSIESGYNWIDNISMK